MALTMRMAAGLGGLAIALAAGSGIASAAPGDEAIVNSTCTYPQVIAALTAEDPAAANQVTSSPVATGWIQSLVAAPPAKRQQLIDQVRGVPQVAQNVGLISQVANTCNNY
ncbi:MAG: hemophore-related protein [Mycobacterium sp.]